MCSLQDIGLMEYKIQKQMYVQKAILLSKKFLEISHIGTFHNLVEIIMDNSTNIRYFSREFLFMEPVIIEEHKMLHYYEYLMLHFTDYTGYVVKDTLILAAKFGHIIYETDGLQHTLDIRSLHDMGLKLKLVKPYHDGVYVLFFLVIINKLAMGLQRNCI